MADPVAGHDASRAIDVGLVVPSGRPSPSVTTPPASRTISSGAQVSHSFSPRVIVTTPSSAPSASAVYLVEAPVRSARPDSPSASSQASSAGGALWRLMPSRSSDSAATDDTCRRVAAPPSTR